MQVAELIVLTNAPNRYTYIIPDSLSLNVGEFVDVYFAKREQVGCVARIYDANIDDFSYSLSPILNKNDKRLLIPPHLLSLIEWFYKHYCVSEYKSLQCIVGLKKNRDDLFKPLNELQPLPKLSDDQQRIFDSIHNASERFHLLHGVTGSGKTQVYAHLIQQVIERSQSAIVLIPEISLTPQFTSFFQTFLVVLRLCIQALHRKERIIWNQCLRGEIDVIVGPRSAIFMPLENLGLIIVDEEHDGSYKQDSTPRYYTHEVAMKCRNSQCKAGFWLSNTFTCYLRKSQTSELMLHSLTKRFNDISCKCICFGHEYNTAEFLIHDQLLEQIELKLKQKQKVLLLVNRRGYSSFKVQCLRLFKNASPVRPVIRITPMVSFDVIVVCLPKK